MIENQSMNTIDNSELEESDLNIDAFIYQPELTKKLDALSGNFDQDIINEIVLWKVNRYVGLSESAIELLNKIDIQSREIDEVFTRSILNALLNSKGIRLPMASTILRFKNPDVYQIIDQRVYRFLYGHTVKYPRKQNEISTLYIDYLRDLKLKCEEHSIPFRYADRILYLADKRLNKDTRLDNY